MKSFNRKNLLTLEDFKNQFWSSYDIFEIYPALIYTKNAPDYRSIEMYIRHDSELNKIHSPEIILVSFYQKRFGFDPFQGVPKFCTHEGYGKIRSSDEYNLIIDQLSKKKSNSLEVYVADGDIFEFPFHGQLN